MGKGWEKLRKKSGIRKGNKTQENGNRKQFNLEEVKKKVSRGITVSMSFATSDLHPYPACYRLFLYSSNNYCCTEARAKAPLMCGGCDIFSQYFLWLNIPQLAAQTPDLDTSRAPHKPWQNANCHHSWFVCLSACVHERVSGRQRKRGRWLRASASRYRRLKKETNKLLPPFRGFHSSSCSEQKQYPIFCNLLVII